MSEPATVLVVDDRAPKRYLLVTWLGRAGYTVIEAETGHDALHKIDTTPVDLVVLDVKLPDLSGFEVCERIKTDPRHHALPVIHVSAHAVDARDRTHGLSNGADAYLTEPIEPDELIATAHAVLRYYQARQRAERLAQRMTFLAETTLAVNLAASATELLRVACEGAARMFEGPAVVAAEIIDGETLAAATGGGGQAVTLRPWVDGDDPPPVGITIRSDPTANWPQVDWGTPDTVAVAVVRLRADRAPVYLAVPAGNQPPALTTLHQLAQAVAAAIEAQRSYDQEHRIALTLQRSLLPRRVPSIAGLELAVRYDPASADTEVGGDFYELTMIDGRLLVAIGDVTGHSLHAATVMAELRHAIRAYAVEGHLPGAIVERVNTLVRTLLPGELATICVIQLDPSSGAARMASAGHLPPLLVTDTGTRYLEHRAPLLGVPAIRPPDLEFTLPHDATLVLYTDGLIERRDADIDDGLRALAVTAANVDDDLDHFCSRLVQELATPHIRDDIAVVAVRRR